MMHKIQFQTGLSLIEFNKLYLSEEACCQKVQEMKWPQGFRCNKCQHSAYWKFTRGHKTIYQCKNCRCQCSLTAGTLFEHTQLPLSTWFLAIHLITQSKNSVSGLELHRQLQVNHKTAWLMKHKIMQMMFDGDREHKLCGRVEIEGAHLGSELEHHHKNQAPIIAAIQTNSKGHPLYAKFTPIANFTESSITNWAKDNLQKDSHCVTSGLASFKVLGKYTIHEVHVKKQPEKHVSSSTFYWVNTVLNNVKTSLCGTFHSINFYKYGFRYLADLQFRFNRRFNLKQLFYSVIKKAALHQPCPRKYLESVETG
ncbi:MAG: IS1595 family transposase [Lentisphaeraceae bacterium]|nr:IS1595 family transposase [Lentisphaeraceae bacterium]